MIQIASESKIGLFHIGIHEGQTTDDIIAPSLRKIIESPDIVKVGVKIFMGDADLLRLRIHLGLQSRGAFELSHLWRLINYVPNQSRALMTYLQALGKQVQEILGLPLNKDPSVRMSNWNRPLSEQQRVYAADDAYAGLMLFHCMNAKRANMLPVPPPLPVLMDYYPVYTGSGFAPPVPIVVQGPLNANTWFRLPHRHLTVADVVRESELLPDEMILYNRLLELSNNFIVGPKTNPRWIPQHRMLIDMAVLQPRDLDGILSIYGMQESKARLFGPQWLGVIRNFEIELEADSSVPDPEPECRSLKRKASAGSSEEIPVLAAPSLHTGLTWIMDQTAFEAQVSSDEESDESYFDIEDFDVSDQDSDVSDQPRVKRTCSGNDRSANSALGQTAAAPILIEDSDEAKSSSAELEAPSSPEQQV